VKKKKNPLRITYWGNTVKWITIYSITAVLTLTGFIFVLIFRSSIDNQIEYILYVLLGGGFIIHIIALIIGIVVIIKNRQAS
jgi:hypothetical protein